jgi:quinol monooxygenase YgiN
MSTVGDFRMTRLRPGKRAEYLRLMQPLCRQVEAEAGTLIYLLHTDRDQPDTVWLYARFRDEGALDAHRSTRVFAEVTRQTGALEAEVDVLDVQLVGNKGVPFEPPGVRALAE